MTSFYMKEETLVTVLVCVFLNAYLKKKGSVSFLSPSAAPEIAFAIHILCTLVYLGRSLAFTSANSILKYEILI